MEKKKVWVLFFSLALILGVAFSVNAQQKTIKIGGVYPLTGNIASTGLDCRRGVELAVDIINGKFDLNLPLGKDGRHSEPRRSKA